MKAVKILVAVMSVLIVIGLGLVAYGVGGSLMSAPSSGTPPSPAVPPKPFSSTDLGQPAGSRIRGMETGRGRLALLVEGGGRDDRVVVVDLESGAVLGTVSLSPP